MPDPTATLAVALAVATGLWLATLAAAILAACARNRWRHAAAEWRTRANVRRRMLRTCWAKKLGPDIDGAMAGRILDAIEREAGR